MAAHPPPWLMNSTDCPRPKEWCDFMPKRDITRGGGPAQESPVDEGDREQKDGTDEDVPKGGKQLRAGAWVRAWESRCAGQEDARLPRGYTGQDRHLVE